MLVLIKVNVLNYKTVKIHKYVQVLVAENLSFHNVRLLGHNGTSKPVKVPILSLALLAAVAGKLTARTTFKVLSFFGWLLTVRTNTVYTGTAHNHIVVTIVTINGVQNFTKNCLFAQRQQVRISWAWCWIFRRHQVCDYHNQDWYFPVPLHTQNYLNPAGPLLAKLNLVFQLTSFPGTACVSS